MFLMKHFYNFLILIFVLIAIILVPVSTSTADIDTKRFLPIKKVAIINSYDIGHICATPQTQGIIDSLSENLDHSFQLDIEVYYMKSNSFSFKNEDSIISKKMKMDIDKFDPDFIFAVDDAAFKYFGLEYSKQRKVYFTGINRRFSEYSKLSDTSNLSGVEEIICLGKMFDFLALTEFYPYKFWIIIDSTPTSHYISNSYVEQLSKHNYKNYEVVQFTTVSELRKFLTSVQGEKNGILLYTFQQLKDDDFGCYRTKSNIMKDMLKYNRKHLEIGENSSYAKQGLAITIAPDLYNMGIETANICVNDTLFNNTNQIILRSKSISEINIQRLEDLSYSWIYRKIVDKVDSTHAKY